jgi:hypothetical protein
MGAVTAADLRSSTGRILPAPGWAVVWDVWKGALTMQIEHGRNVKMLAAFSLVGLTLAWGVSLRIPDIYVSEAAIRSAATPESLHQSLEAVLSRPRLKALIEKHQLYASDWPRMPMEEIVERVKKNVYASPIGKDPAKRAFAVGFACEDGAVAQRVTTDLAAALTQAGHVLDPASNLGPIYPNRPVFAFTGLLAGALIGVTWAALKRLHA